MVVQDALGDFVVVRGNMTSFDLAPVDILSVAVRNDGANLVVSVETKSAFPAYYSPYESPELDDLHMPDLALSIMVKMPDGEGFIWLSLVTQSLGLSVCVMFQYNLCDSRLSEQPVRYSISGLNTTGVFPLDMSAWAASPSSLLIHVDGEFAEYNPINTIRDYAPGGNVDSPSGWITYPLWK